MLFFYLNLKPINSVVYSEKITESHDMVEESKLPEITQKEPEKAKTSVEQSKDFLINDKNLF